MMTNQAKARPTRRDSYVVLLAVTAVCIVAREIAFLFVFLTALALPRLPRPVRIFAAGASLAIFAFGVYEIATNS
jgi:hypothetical protein